MPETVTHGGKCPCGAVEFSVTGQLEAMGYCHCTSCRDWSAAPINAFALWPLGSVEIIKGADNIGAYERTGQSRRKWCKSCGGHLFADLPGWNMAAVFLAAVPSVSFEPAFHIHYQEAVLSMKDGLPKHKDLPKEFGGSGELLQE